MKIRLSPLESGSGTEQEFYHVEKCNFIPGELTAYRGHAQTTFTLRYDSSIPTMLICEEDAKGAL
jgi:hypothetical protein